MNVNILKCSLRNHRISISNTSTKSEGLLLTNDLWDFYEFFALQESFVSSWFGFQNSRTTDLEMTSLCRNNTKSPEIISVFLSLRKNQLKKTYSWTMISLPLRFIIAMKLKILKFCLSLTHEELLSNLQSISWEKQLH